LPQLTDHFTQEELGVLGCEPRLIDNAEFLAKTVLEGIRTHFGPVDIHCGYRDPAHNARVGGKPNSFHLFADGHSAADLASSHVSLPQVFDWIRLESKLPFDKVILEKNSAGSAACVHIQADRLNKPRREAYIGGTGACQHYEPVEVQ
jgi:hypothetical protein